MKETISVIAGVIFLIGFVPYIIAILKRKAEPSKATWIVWSIIDTIAVVGMYLKDSLNGQIIGATIGAIVIMLLSFKYGSSGWTRLEKFCLFGAFLGLSLWWIFNDAVLGIVTTQVVAFIGSFPTFAQAWKGKESKLTWTIFFASSVLTIFVIKGFTFEDAAQPINFLLASMIMFVILWFKKQKYGMSADFYRGR